ncbi:Ldh family oxidoreductase [Achromobacter pestifer]|uniref:Delta(1)-pyrroline-2-carboxylate reductase n=1 Tax=Achromobacter pestifer TaxID=1353889 RepID=A0A6S6YV18_9BURK|nr:Ldh family oxidoreductase [Achromobacter pestifer]CAB3635443.1 Delta(1)-pyrroline-2-carboxylate reductase [Achromobacter pestifer]
MQRSTGGNVNTDMINLSIDQVYDLSVEVLGRNGFSAPHAAVIAQTITAGQRDDCQSHGLYRLMGCVRTLKSGLVDPSAQPIITHPAAGVVQVDAQRAYSLLAFQEGLPHLAEKAKRNGVAVLAINNCFHFSALWPEVEAIAQHGLAGIAMTPSHSWVAPAGGTRPVFGTNPLAFAWPRPGGNPYVFDFATSMVARGEIELHRRSGKPIPEGWAIDKNGQPTTDAAAGLDGAMLTFGSYKGSALSTMIELLAGPLIGDWTSLQSQAFDGSTGGTPLHGELLIALDPDILGRGQRAINTAGAEAMLDAISGQGARLPSERRFIARAKSEREGVWVNRALYDEIKSLGATPSPQA